MKIDVHGPLNPAQGKSSETTFAAHKLHGLAIRERHDERSKKCGKDLHVSWVQKTTDSGLECLKQTSIDEAKDP